MGYRIVNYRLYQWYISIKNVIFDVNRTIYIWWLHIRKRMTQINLRKNEYTLQCNKSVWNHCHIILLWRYFCSYAFRAYILFLNIIYCAKTYVFNKFFISKFIISVDKNFLDFVFLTFFLVFLFVLVFIFNDRR